MAPFNWGVSDPEDVALLEKIHAGIVRYGMEVPAIFMLESLLPMALLGSQAMLFLAPVLSVVVPIHGYERAARLLERREIIERLIVSIEWSLDGREQKR